MTKRLRVTLLAAILLVAVLLAFRAVDTRPLPQVGPTLDVLEPTRPILELEATATPVP
jgi:hypothetical protein